MKKNGPSTIARSFLFLVWIIAALSFSRLLSTHPSPLIQSASAHSNNLAQSANLIVGNQVSISNTNVGSWRGTIASDNAFWSITRVATSPSLDVQFSFTNTQLNNANKLLITVEDANVTTGTAYIHQICDWSSATGVDNTADAYCTGGGWRTLQPLKTTYTNTADTSRTYEIYDGYFWVLTPSPGTPISTPLTNFVNSSSNNTVLIRTYSSASATTQYNIDYIKIEPAIDPYYEPSAMTKIAGGTTTNSVAHLIGAASTNLTSSDNVRLSIPMSATSTSVDTYFSFNNVRTFPGMNTLLFSPELCVSNVALTYGFYLYNFTSSTWTQLGSSYTGTACTTDSEYALSFNDTSIPGFSISDYISGSKEVRFRILTNAPASVYNIQLDKIYLMTGAVNSNSSDCEISFGTGTATNCTNTRQIKDVKTATPSTSTWQATAALEYPASYYSLDNDDDTTNAEYATSQNLSFGIAPTTSMTITGVHYAVKYRSNSTAQTMDLQIRDYTGTLGTSGWVNTPGTDTNLATTYSWYDTWALAEQQLDAPKMVDTVNGKMNLRARTSAGTTTNPGTRDWAFAMMSIRWVEDPNRSTLLGIHSPTGGLLVTGNETATSASNTGSWKGTLGNDSATNGSGNYWTIARTATGLNAQLYFDGVELYGANKMIIRTESANITTATNYVFQICDWISTDGVDNSADTQCTGGGWRTLHPLKTQSTVTSDTTVNYHLYDGYFWNTATGPGVKYTTPLSNFTRSGDKRVLVRAYSTVNSTVQLRIDYVQVEVAIDSAYSPSAINKLGTYTSIISLAGSSLVGTTGSDGSKMIFANSATNPIDVEFRFSNVVSYSGANTILIRPEVCTSVANLNFTFYAYNYTTASWTTINTSAFAGTACTTDTTYSAALNGINPSDYIQAGEVRIRLTTPASTASLSLDRIYMMLGTTNSDTSGCQISFGTGTAANCANTATVRDVDAGTVANTTTWQNTSQLEYAATSPYARDNDFDATAGEAATANIIPLSVSPTNSMSITAIGWAARARSNIATITETLTVLSNAGFGALSSWTTTGYANAATTYSASDSFLGAEILSDANNMVSSGNRMLLHFMTTTSTATTAGTVSDFDFVMGSIRFLLPPSGILTTDIVDETGTSVATPSITFGASQVGFTCQPTTGTLGTSSQKIRISNSTGNASWTLTIAALLGNTALWDSGTNTYDFNDSAGAPPGCSDGGDTDSVPGQLTFDFSSATITPQAGCSNTGITLGTNTGFVEGSTDNIVVAQASGSAQTNCYWDITGISVQQTIPFGQTPGTYSLSTNLTIAAN